MNPRDVRLHPDFPDKLWVVVEQPADEEYRFEYDEANDRFVRTKHRSLPFARGFGGAYGWVGGLGTPPGKHVDVYLVTRKKTRPGDVILGHTCGIFCRLDGDHKLITLDAESIRTVERADLVCLDNVTLTQLHALYPQIRDGEGWFGADQARAYLLNSDQT